MTFKKFLEDRKIPFKEEGEDIWVEDCELTPYLDEIRVLFPELSIEVETTFEGTEEEFKLFLKQISEEDLKLLKDFEDIEEWEEWSDEDWANYWSEDDEPGSDSDIDK